MSASNEVPLNRDELSLILRALGTHSAEFANEVRLSDADASELAAIEDLDAKLWSWLSVVI